MQPNALWHRMAFGAALDQKESRLYMFGGFRRPESETLVGSLWSLDLCKYSGVKYTHGRRHDILVRGWAPSSVKSCRI